MGWADLSELEPPPGWRRVIHWLRGLIDKRWWAILLGVSIGLSGLAIGRSLLDVDGFSIAVDPQPPINIDAALFEHAGWYIRLGATPYVDIWDIKPPLGVETTALLALISFGNVYILHLLSVLVTTAAGTATVLLVGVLVHRLTGSRWVGLVGGLVMLTLPGFYSLASLGFRPRYLTMALGLLAIELMLRNRPFWAGVCGAAATGYFLMGAVFPLIVLLIWGQTRPGSLWRLLGGMSIATALALLPILAWGAMIPMLTEVLLVPLSTPEHLSISSTLARVLENVRFVSLLVPFGLYGLLRYGLRRPWRWAWTALGGAWFALQVLFLDFDSFPDFFGTLIFVALGVGFVLAHSGKLLRRGVVALIIGLLAFSGVWSGSIGFLFPPFDPPGQSAREEVAGREGIPNMAYLYWNQVQPETCHYRLSVVERQWLERTGQPLYATECEPNSLGDILAILRDQPD
jgi:hypothetical protein